MSNISQKQTTYLFVDGSHFRQYFNETTQKWFGQVVEFDFRKIKEFFNAEKAFYYDCIDDIKNDSETDEEFEARVNSQEEKLNKIREVEGCHVYLGSLRRAKKQKNRGQKEVDVMLAVHMMEHAFRGNVSKTVLLSGDLDFRPLVESLVRFGLFVEVSADLKHFSTELIHSADAHKKLSIDEYFRLTPNHIQSLKPIEFPTRTFFRERAEKENFWLHKEGTCGDFEVYIYIGNQHRGHWLTTSNDLPHPQTAWVNNNLDHLILYFELKYGPINWK
ncbi:MAG TPA: NYN domain-containing protein [Pyrinomonadaceae bacterium]|jgi:uncharacterized LabA/DUF88 family protein